MEELKQQFQRAYHSVELLREKLGQEIFLSENEISQLFGGLDKLRKEQERIRQALADSGVSPPGDEEMNLRKAEELFRDRDRRRKELQTAKDAAAKFLSVRTADAAYREVLRPFQQKAAAWDDVQLLEKYRDGELTPYLKFTQYVEMDAPPAADMQPLADVFGYQLLFGVMAKQFHFQSDAGSPAGVSDAPAPRTEQTSVSELPEESQTVLVSKDETPAPEDTDKEEKKDPPPLTDLDKLGVMTREQSDKCPKSVKALIKLCNNSWETTYIINEIVHYYLFAPDMLAREGPEPNTDLIDKELSRLLKEGYLAKYTMDRYPGKAIYAATDAGNLVFQKGALKKFIKRIPRKDRPALSRRMENAADFIRRYEGRFYFNQMFTNDHAVYASYTESVAPASIMVRRTEGAPLLCVMIPAAIFTQADSEDAVEDLYGMIRDELENSHAEPDFRVFLAACTDEEAKGWADHLRGRVDFPAGTRFFLGRIGGDDYRDETGMSVSLSGHIRELIERGRQTGTESGKSEESETGTEAASNTTAPPPEPPVSDGAPETSGKEENPPRPGKQQKAETSRIRAGKVVEKSENLEKTVKKLRPVPAPRPRKPADITEIRQEMYRLFAEGRFPCALTISRILSRDSAELEALYRQYACALDDPAMDKRYCYSELQAVFSEGFGREGGNAYDALGLSAYLRLFFSRDALSEPYYIKNCVDDLEACRPLQRVPHLKTVIYDLGRCFERTRTLFTPETLSNLIDSSNNRSLRGQYREKAARFLASRPDETQQINSRLHEIFRELLGTSSRDKRKSIFRAAAEAVKDGDEEKTEEIRGNLAPFLREGADLTGECGDEHLDWGRIEQTVEDAWRNTEGRVTRRKTDNLKDPARSTLINRVAEAVKLSMSWVSLGVNSGAHDLSEDDRSFLNKLRKNIAGAMGSAAVECLSFQEDTPPEERAAMGALSGTLETLAYALLNGWDEDNKRWFYLDFLTDNRIEIDENYIPCLEEGFSEISPMNLCGRVIRHSRTEPVPWPGVLRRIFEDAEAGCDFGHAELIRSYLLVNEPEFQWPAAYGFSNSVETARKRLEDEDRNFQARLELAESYGWIDDTSKIDYILADMENRREHYLNTQNFGFYFRTAQAYLEVLQQEAESRKSAYLAELEGLRAEKGDWPIFAEIERLISQQMYTVAQDYMDQARDQNQREVPASTHLASGSDAFQGFLSRYTSLHSDAREAATINIVQIYRRRHRDKGIARSGEAMLERWPRSPAKDMSQTLKELFQYMSLPVDRVEKETAGQDNHYLMTFENSGRDVNYPHPIGAYGTEMRGKGLHVFLTFGKRNDSTMNTELQKLMTASLDGPAIVLADTAISLADRRSLAQMLKSQSQTSSYIILDRVLLFYLAEFPRLERWNVLLRCALPFHYYNPYTQSSTAELCPEMFIGRRDELNSIVDEGGANIVYGGRQLGKTALLQRARNLCDVRERGQWAFYLDIRDRNAADTAQQIYWMLADDRFLEEPEGGEVQGITWDELTRKIIRRMKDTEKPVKNLLLLLDEADVFLQSCGGDECNYAPIGCFKRIQSSTGCFKFVLAGLHKVMRFYKQASQDNDSPIPHLATITMKPLPFHEARELVELPLSYLGFKIQPEDEYLIAQILSSTNYFPGLIQYYCSSLVNAVNRDYQGDVNERPPYWLKESQILTLLKDRDFQKNIREKFEITLGVDNKEQGYYNTIAYSLARCHFDRPEDIASGYTAGDIRSVCRSLDIHSVASLSMEQMDELLNELTELNILRRRGTDGEDRYIFSRASFRHMLGDENQVDDKLTAIMEKEGMNHAA